MADAIVPDTKNWTFVPSNPAQSITVTFISGTMVNGVVRTYSGLSAATATYTAAQQVADGGTVASVVYARVYQRSAVVGRGTAPVEVVSIGMAAGSPVELYYGNFTFQVAALSSRENAERLRAELNPRFGNAHIVEFDRGDNALHKLQKNEQVLICAGSSRASSHQFFNYSFHCHAMLTRMH